MLFCLSDPEPETVPYSCYYTMPMCDEDGFDAALDIIAADAAESGRPLRFCCVPEEYMDNPLRSAATRLGQTTCIHMRISAAIRERRFMDSGTMLIVLRVSILIINLFR